jgi:EpsI family protein
MIPLATWPRFLVVFACLSLTAALLHFRNTSEAIVPHRDLALFPRDIAGWQGTDVKLSTDELAVLGPGQFLLRDYDRASTPPVTLFLAYYPSQRAGDTMHSPKNCLPGSGWTPTKSAAIRLRAADGTEINANRYLVSQGTDRMVVLYWYQSHSRTVASEYWAKWFLVKDAILTNHTDGALVRIDTSIEGSEDDAAAEQRVLSFAATLSPLLGDYIPR